MFPLFCSALLFTTDSLRGMIPLGVFFLLFFSSVLSDKLDLNSCRYKDNACVGIRYFGKNNYSLAMSGSEGCFKTANCDIILRGTVGSKDNIKWILRIAAKTIHQDVEKDIYFLVHFGVMNELNTGIHIEFETARTKFIRGEPKITKMYNPFGKSIVKGLEVPVDENTSQSVFYLEKYEPQNITDKTQYFYIYFWSGLKISYSTANGSFSCETNLIKDNYYLNLYSSRYVAYGGYTASPLNETVTNDKINLFRHGRPKPVSTPEDTGNKLLVVLLVVVFIFAVAVIICLMVCCLKHANEPVSMETQKRNGISTFHSIETTVDVKKSNLHNKSTIADKKPKRLKSKKPF